VDAVDAVLNSATAQKLRKSVRWVVPVLQSSTMRVMIQGQLPARDELKRPQIVNAIATQDFKDFPRRAGAFWIRSICNLACPSCRRDRIIEKASLSEENAGAVETKLLPLLPHINT